MQQCCDWSKQNKMLDDLTDFIVNKNVSDQPPSPFPLLAMVDAPDLHLSASQAYINRQCKDINPKFEHTEIKHLPEKIRIAYLSADFYGHPVAYLTSELFELHNREQFEIFALPPSKIMRKPPPPLDLPFCNVKPSTTKSVATSGELKVKTRPLPSASSTVLAGSTTLFLQLGSLYPPSIIRMYSSLEVYVKFPE